MRLAHLRSALHHSRDRLGDPPAGLALAGDPLTALERALEQRMHPAEQPGLVRELAQLIPGRIRVARAKGRCDSQDAARKNAGGRCNPVGDDRLDARALAASVAVPAATVSAGAGDRDTAPLACCVDAHVITSGKWARRAVPGTRPGPPRALPSSSERDEVKMAVQRAGRCACRPGPGPRRRPEWLPAIGMSPRPRHPSAAHGRRTAASTVERPRVPARRGHARDLSA